jgi:hypothetical protein
MDVGHRPWTIWTLLLRYTHAWVAPGPTQRAAERRWCGVVWWVLVVGRVILNSHAGPWLSILLRGLRTMLQLCSSAPRATRIKGTWCAICLQCAGDATWRDRNRTQRWSGHDRDGHPPNALGATRQRQGTRRPPWKSNTKSTFSFPDRECSGQTAQLEGGLDVPRTIGLDLESPFPRRFTTSFLTLMCTIDL